MEYIRLICPVLVGALIGYCTNYIAIKMLFRPRKPVYVLGKKIPFTPGVIPKNQDRIASAVGNAVGHTLFTKEDILTILNGDAMKQQFVASVGGYLYNQSISTGEVLQDWDTSTSVEEKKDGLDTVITNKIVEALKKVAYDSLIMDIGKNTFDELLSNPMLAMFLNDSFFESIAQKMGEGAKEFVESNGASLVRPLVEKETAAMFARTPGDNLKEWEISEVRVSTVMEKIYSSIVIEKAEQWLNQLKIDQIVEEKIKAMPVEELEDLTMSVMKQELQAVINLGAIIGALIGVINIFLYL